MKSMLLRATLLLVALIPFNQAVLADNDAAAKAIAEILVGLNHFPSDAEKAVLMDIAQDQSNGQGIRAVAQAVHDMQHSLSAESKEAMAQIMASDCADPRAKALAEIVSGINKMAGDQAKASLQAML